MWVTTAFVIMGLSSVGTLIGLLGIDGIEASKSGNLVDKTSHRYFPPGDMEQVIANLYGSYDSRLNRSQQLLLWLARVCFPSSILASLAGFLLWL